MDSTHKKNRIRITAFVSAFCIALLVFAFIVDTPQEIFSGEWIILTSPSILITDYIALAGLGATLFNTAVTVLMSLGLAWLIKARFNGYLVCAIFTVAGFAFFGKNPFNVVPVWIGVYVYDQVFAHKNMADLIAPLLFGTTLGPVVSQTAFGFGTGVSWLLLGILLGFLAGMLLAALMGHIYKMHLGYNLYNTGTTGGFVGTVVYMAMRGFGLQVEPASYWSTEYTAILSWFFLAFLLITILLGIIWGASAEQYKKIYKSWGRLTTDYVNITDLGTTMVNMGLVGLIALGYIHLVDGDVNGATLAGILTVFGFGALGKHPRNIIPIMVGVAIMTIPNVWSHNEPGPLLAALFCTTLAPLAGRFGFLAGIAAGALHLPMVMHVGQLHGYMNLYNNGFAGGLAMLLIVGFINGLRPHWLREPQEGIMPEEEINIKPGHLLVDGD